MIKDVFFIQRQSKPIPKEHLEKMEVAGFMLVEIDNPKDVTAASSLDLLSSSATIRLMADAIKEDDNASEVFGKIVCEFLIDNCSMELTNDQ